MVRGLPSISKPRYGFSLMELVVVIAVVAVLAMLIIPVYRSVKNSAHGVNCSSNFRQIYFATLAFVGDHDGKLPPDLGSAAAADKVDSRFWWRQYWFDTAYLGRYVLHDMQRRMDSPGRIKQHEAEVFNCPARFAEGPDEDFAQGQNAGVSYVMRKLFQTPKNYLFHAIEDKDKKLLFTEGRKYTLVPGNALSGWGAEDGSRRLRRYHNGALHILYMDGRVELFSGEDERIAEMVTN